MQFSNRAAGPHNPDTCVLSVHWMFCMILRLGAHENLLRSFSFGDHALPRELGFSNLVAERDLDDKIPVFLGGRPSPNQRTDEDYVRLAIETMDYEWQLLQRDTPSPQYPDCLGENLAQLGVLHGLDELEQKIVGLAVLIDTDPFLTQVSDMLPAFDQKVVSTVARLLDAKPEAVSARLVSSGSLAKLGLIDSHEEAFFLQDYLCLPIPNIAKTLRYRQRLPHLGRVGIS